MVNSRKFITSLDGNERTEFELLSYWAKNCIRDKKLSLLIIKFLDDHFKHNTLNWIIECNIFPKWNQRLNENSGTALHDFNLKFIKTKNYLVSNKKPSGKTDPFIFKLSDKDKDKLGMPFLFLSNKQLTMNDCSSAALVAIHHFEFLSEIFNWNKNKVNNGWDGAELLGLSKNAEKEIDKAFSNWFIPLEHKPSIEFPVILISKPVIEQLNWYLQKIKCGYSLGVYDYSSSSKKLTNQIFPTPKIDKTINIDWPVARNIEIASTIINKSQTEIISNIIKLFTFKYVKSQLGNDILNKYQYLDQANKKTRGKFYKYQEFLDIFGHNIEEKQKKRKINKTVSFDENNFIKNAINRDSDIERSLLKVDTKSYERIVISYTNPLPIKNSEVSIFSVVGEKEIFLILAYKLVNEEFSSFSELSNYLTLISENYFSHELFTFADLKFSTDNLKWANPNTKISEGCEIICPDPRTINSEITKFSISR